MNAQLVCPSCKQPITEDQKFCPHCGKVLQLQARLASDQLTGTIPDVLKQYDAIAGNIITISGVLVSLYSAGIFAGRIITGQVFAVVVYVLPLALLLGAIIFAIQVFYPRGYIVDATFEEIIDKKERRLLFCTGFFCAAVVVLICGLVVYLLRPTA